MPIPGGVGIGGRPSPFRSLIGTPDLSVLADAFGVRGGLADPAVLRADAGIYLQADVVPLLQWRETEQIISVQSAAVAAGATELRPIPELGPTEGTVTRLAHDTVLIAPAAEMLGNPAPTDQHSALLQVSASSAPTAFAYVWQAAGGTSIPITAGGNHIYQPATAFRPVLLHAGMRIRWAVFNGGASGRTVQTRLLAGLTRTVGVAPRF